MKQFASGDLSNLSLCQEIFKMKEKHLLLGKVLQKKQNTKTPAATASVLQAAALKGSDPQKGAIPHSHGSSLDEDRSASHSSW